MRSRSLQFNALFPKRRASMPPPAQQRSPPNTRPYSPSARSAVARGELVPAAPSTTSTPAVPNVSRGRLASRPDASRPEGPAQMMKQPREMRNGEPEGLRESWVLMVEGRSGHLKVMEKPPLDVCAHCEANVRAAYDGPCQTMLRLKWERQWQKQVQLEVDALRRMYSGRIPIPEALEKLQSEVEALQETIDLLLSDVPVPKHLLPSVRLQSALKELEVERSQNTLLETALQELQRVLQEEDSALVEENHRLRQELAQHRTGPSTPKHDLALLHRHIRDLQQELDFQKRVSAEEGADGAKQHWEVALQSQRAANEELRRRVAELEARAVYSPRIPPPSSPKLDELRQERDGLEFKLNNMAKQLSILTQERDALQTRVQHYEKVKGDDGTGNSHYGALKLESEMVTLKGELLVERQAHETLRAMLDMEKERRNLMERRTEEDGKELATLREECLRVTGELAKVNEQLRQKERHSLSSDMSEATRGTSVTPAATVTAAEMEGGRDYLRTRVHDLQQALNAEKQMTDTLRQQAGEWERKAAALLRNEKVIAEQLQALKDELLTKETQLTEAEATVQAQKRMQQDLERELRRLRDDMQVLRNRSGRSSPIASKFGSGRTTPVRACVSPPQSPNDRGIGHTLTHSALILARSNDSTGDPPRSPLILTPPAAAGRRKHSGGAGGRGTASSQLPLAVPHLAAPPHVLTINTNATSHGAATDTMTATSIDTAIPTTTPTHSSISGVPPLYPITAPEDPSNSDLVLSPSGPRCGRVSDVTMDPGTPRDDDLDAPEPIAKTPSDAPTARLLIDSLPAEVSLSVSEHLQATAEQDKDVATILAELRNAHRRHLFNPESVVLTRAEADAILSAAQRLRERATASSSWREAPAAETDTEPVRRPSKPHATKVVEAVTFYESLRRAAEAAADQSSLSKHIVSNGILGPPADHRCWQTVTDCTEGLYGLLDS